jgi:Tol biopolymer transport system component
MSEGRRMGAGARLLARAAAAFLLLLTVTASVRAASFPPEYRFRSVSGERVVVHFHQGLEVQARTAMALSDEILAGYELRYGSRPGRVHVVLADAEDGPNGFATPLPYPIVNVRVAAPDGTDAFGNYEDWLRLVLTHELAHIVHLEDAGSAVAGLRKVFGRAPWLFPNVLTPAWMIEGLATYEETERTAFGRGRSSDTHMVLRMAALADAFPGLDQAVLALDRWPAGQTPYLFGEGFLRDLEARNGPGTLPRLSRVHSGRIIPFLDDLTAKRVTGAGFGRQWRAWSETQEGLFAEAAARLEAAGITRSQPLTARGIRQVGPRFSPDGAWIAYTSRELTRYGAIRLMRADGSEDRRLRERNGGDGLAWTPDGRTLVYDEPEVYRNFAVRSDLRALDVESGRRRNLTNGLRARDPDVAPDGRRVVFVRRFEARSELWLLDLETRALAPLVGATPGTVWSGPRWSPRGDALVAARWQEGGWLDLVLIDAATGTTTPLQRDRARDVEAQWLPDAEHVLFRSDRDGISNLYVMRLADGAVRRVTRVLGGAFAPSVSPDGTRVVFVDYSATGYDLHGLDLRLDALPTAEPFVDTFPAPRPSASGTEAEVWPYRPLAALAPRFWSPYFFTSSDEWRLGVATGGSDPLFRHAWGLGADWGTETHRGAVSGFYQYDRWWPTFLVTGEDRTERESGGPVVRSRTLNLRATVPLTTHFRWRQLLSLTWRRERETLENAEDVELNGPDTLDLGGLELAWTLSNAQRYPYSVSPIDGGRLRVAYMREDPALGSDLELGKLTGDARAYLRLSGGGQVLALRAGAGTTFGAPDFERSFAVGGFPDGSLFDLVGTNPALLRGYPKNAFVGRRYLTANAEYRFPLRHPQRGLGTVPAFLRHLHGSLFVDAAHAWSGELRGADVKTSAGAALGADTVLFQGLPFTFSLGIAHGFDERGETQVYFRTGLSF